jgi:hypothetical protein
MRTFHYFKRYVRAATWSGLPRASIAIETGTYYGDGALDLAKFFRTVHTIELSPKWHEFASRRLAEFKNVTCHLGDSAEVLARILPEINEPVLFYLDAHWSGGETARGVEEIHLVREWQSSVEGRSPATSSSSTTYA